MSTKNDVYNFIFFKELICNYILTESLHEICKTKTLTFQHKPDTLLLGQASVKVKC